jgi:hypothetical protein
MTIHPMLILTFVTHHDSYPWQRRKGYAVLDSVAPQTMSKIKTSVKGRVTIHRHDASHIALKSESPHLSIQKKPYIGLDGGV